MSPDFSWTQQSCHKFVILIPTISFLWELDICSPSVSNLSNFLFSFSSQLEKEGRPAVEQSMALQGWALESTASVKWKTQFCCYWNWWKMIPGEAKAQETGLPLGKASQSVQAPDIP